MDSNSARLSTQSKILPRRLMVIAKFTCVVVPTAGITSTSTACSRSIMLNVRGRVPMNVERGRLLAGELFLRRCFEPET
jgi:hypothetical protein